MSPLTPFNAADPDLRASDADRDQVAAVLGEALASGRLTSAEHADRLAAAYAAVTVGELLPLVRDLPQPAAPGPVAAAAGERQEITAVFSKVIRRGRWLAGRHTRLRAACGALIVDLSEAVLPGREITLDAKAVFGKLIVHVPEDARVLDEGAVVFGKRHVAVGGQDPGGPLIKVTGTAVFGKVMVVRRRDRPY